MLRSGGDERGKVQRAGVGRSCMAGLDEAPAKARTAS